MRVSIVSVFVATIAAGACNRSGTAPVRSDNRVDASGVGATTTAAAIAPEASGSSPSATEPAVREVTIPAGTALRVVLDTTVGSDTSRAEERVAAHLAGPVVVHGETALPSGSRVGGIVTDAVRSGKVKGRAHVALRFESLSPAGDDRRYAIRTAAIGRTAAATKRKDALEIGAPAAGGALIGALVGGSKGALVGTAVGGGAGTAVVLSTRGKEVRIPKGTALTLKLAAPLTIRVRA